MKFDDIKYSEPVYIKLKDTPRQNYLGTWGPTKRMLGKFLMTERDTKTTLVYSPSENNSNKISYHIFEEWIEEIYAFEKYPEYFL